MSVHGTVYIYIYLQDFDPLSNIANFISSTIDVKQYQMGAKVETKEIYSSFIP